MLYFGQTLKAIGLVEYTKELNHFGGIALFWKNDAIPQIDLTHLVVFTSDNINGPYGITKL